MNSSRHPWSVSETVIHTHQFSTQHYPPPPPLWIMRLNQFIKVYILSKSLDLHIHCKCISTFTFYLKCKKKKNELINFISKCTDFIRWIYIIHVYDAIYFLSYPEQIISVLAFHQVLIIISTCSKSSTKFWLTFKTTRKWWF